MARTVYEWQQVALGRATLDDDGGLENLHDFFILPDGTWREFERYIDPSTGVATDSTETGTLTAGDLARLDALIDRYNSEPASLTYQTAGTSPYNQYVESLYLVNHDGHGNAEEFQVYRNWSGEEVRYLADDRGDIREINAIYDYLNFLDDKYGTDLWSIQG